MSCTGHVDWRAVELCQSQHKDICRDRLAEEPWLLFSRGVLQKLQSFQKHTGAVRRFPFSPSSLLCKALWPALC